MYDKKMKNNTIYMRDGHREAFKSFADKIVKNVTGVERVVLFGSVARGDHGVNSDVDVLIEVGDLSVSSKIEDIAFDTTSEFGISVTPVIIQEGRGRKKLLETIEDEGVEYVRG